MAHNQTMVATPHHVAIGSTSMAPNAMSGRPHNRPRRPCDACRKRKSRCEMVEGETICVLCRFHHQPCLFQQNPQPRRKKRKVSNEGLDGREDSRGDTNRSAHVPPLETNDGPGNIEAAAAIERRASGSIRQQPLIDDYANLKGPSLLKKTLGLQNHRHSRYLGGTSVYEQYMLSVANVDDNLEIPLGPASSIRKVGDNTAFLLRPDAGTQSRDEEIIDLDAIETLVAPHGQALINLYFRIVHPTFPILHKKVFLEKYQRTHREFSPPLLAAVYILALNWWSYSSDLALLPKPDVSLLEKLAIKTMSYIVFRPKISTIQAGLLLLQRPEGDSWALTTQLVGLGQDLGLHLDCSKWRIPSWERGLRKRLAWALYMQDKWGSLVHARPSHITPSDWLVRPVQADDFPERAADEDDEEGSTEVEKGRILFCEMIRLTEILTSILTEFYSLRAEGQMKEHTQEGGRWVLERAKPIQLRLRDWHQQLPECLMMDNVKMRKLNSVGYLHLAYYGAEITLHRQILRSLTNERDANLISICRSAANSRLTTVMDFVRGLRAEHLQSFWYSASKYCFAVVGTFIGLLWVTSTSKEESEGFKERLEEYRWTLRLSSKSAEFLDRAISVLTSSTGLLIKAIPEDARPVGASPAVGKGPANNVASPEEGIDEPAPSHTNTYGEAEDDEEDWAAGADQVSLTDSFQQQSPTSFSESNAAAMDMIWPEFAMSASASGTTFAIPNGLMEASGEHNGFNMRPFMDIEGNFDVPAAFQPHYGATNGT